MLSILSYWTKSKREARRNRRAAKKAAEEEERKAQREELQAKIDELEQELGTPSAQRVQAKLNKLHDLRWQRRHLGEPQGCAS